MTLDNHLLAFMLGNWDAMCYSFIHPSIHPSIQQAFFECLLCERHMLGTEEEFSWVSQSCLTLCDPMDCSTPGLPVHHHLLELAQTHVHWVSDAIQTSHPLLSPSSPAFGLSQHWGLFEWVGSSHQVAKVLELHHHSLQWLFRVYFL